ERLQYAVQELGFSAPTPIQAKAIPEILSGKDVIGLAKTGTGKTAAFSLPSLQRFLTKHYDAEYVGPRVLILSPTRELAFQVERNVRELAKYLDINVCLLLGGMPYKRQLRDLENWPDIIVATPGRLLDHVEQKNVNLRTIDTFILDEGDRMLDMGFLPDIRRLIRYLGKDSERQTLMFSATFPDAIQRLAGSLMKDPVKVDVTTAVRTPENIVLGAFYIEKVRKPRLLRELLAQPDMNSVMVFCGMKIEADFIYEVLVEDGRNVAVLHSDRDQKERTRALESFRTGDVDILVATDIAARGLDIKDVSHVINYDLPNNFEDFVHRVGRTARAEAHGEALSFVTPGDRLTFEQIERKLGRVIERRTFKDLTLDGDWTSETPNLEPIVEPTESDAEGEKPESEPPKPFRRRR
ncbi:MAG TPA: DEAD/DEAH box helicase, partial [Opitutales bacterium]|nr:DEAD/DEAH box helicase [Opitutales bacterium]